MTAALEKEIMARIDLGLDPVLQSLDLALESVPAILAKPMRGWVVEFLRKAYVQGQEQLLAELQKGLLDQFRQAGMEGNEVH